jgi:CRISPR-associated protein Cas6
MTFVDLAFPVQGSHFPLDHGYVLYSALCRTLPDLHVQKTVGVHPIRGAAAGDGRLRVGPQTRLRIRTPADRIALFLPLAGTSLVLDDARLRIGVPQVFALAPAANLAARMVTIKGFMAPEAFLEAARRQLTDLGIAAEVTVVIPSISEGRRSAGGPLRRVLRVKDKTVVGFALRILGLSAEESLTLQERGLGGRRHMGCGIFGPCVSMKGE